MKLTGKYLKEVRTRNHIKLKTISKDLKISLSFLEALENDDFSKTPGGVYDIGFIRSYSDYLNLNSDLIVEEYKKQIAFSTVKDPIVLPKPIVGFNPFISYKTISFFSVIIISGFFYFMFVSRSEFNNEFAITSDIPEELEAELEKYNLNNNSSNLVIANQEIKKDKLKYTENNLKNEDSNQITVIASTPTNSDQNEISNSISIKVLDTTWVQIRNIKNEVIFSKLMSTNDEYNYFLTDNYSITTGNAGNIIISIAGQVMGKLGKKGEVLDSIKVSKNYFSN